MGSVTSYDVTKGHKKRNELPNFSSDDVSSGSGSDTEDEMNNNGPLQSNKNNNTTNTKNENRIQRNDNSKPDTIYPTPKPRSVQSKMSTSSSSNISSSKSSDSKRAIDATTSKHKRSDTESSNERFIPKSSHLPPDIKQSEKTEKMRNSDILVNSAENVKQVDNVHKYDNDELINDKTVSKQKTKSSNSKPYLDKVPNEEESHGNDIDVQPKVQLGRSKSYIDIDSGLNASKGLRYDMI